MTQKKQLSFVSAAANNDHFDSVDYERMCRCECEGRKGPRDRKGNGELIVIHGKYKNRNNIKGNGL